MSTHATPDLEGYDAFVASIIESFTLEERLAGLAPQERLAGLAPEEAVLCLPDEALRALSTQYIDALPERVRSVVRAPSRLITASSKALAPRYVLRKSPSASTPRSSSGAPGTDVVSRSPTMASGHA